MVTPFRTSIAIIIAAEREGREGEVEGDRKFCDLFFFSGIPEKNSVLLILAINFEKDVLLYDQRGHVAA